MMRRRALFVVQPDVIRFLRDLKVTEIGLWHEMLTHGVALPSLSQSVSLDHGLGSDDAKACLRMRWKAK